MKRFYQILRTGLVLVCMLSFSACFPGGEKVFTDLSEAQIAALETMVGIPFPEDMTIEKCRYAEAAGDITVTVYARYPHAAFRKYIQSLNDDNIRDLGDIYHVGDIDATISLEYGEGQIRMTVIDPSAANFSPLLNAE